MATQSRDPITCHVLDTTTGRPAANLSVTLVCCTIPNVIFHCKTNADGRILNWQNTQGSQGELGAHYAAVEGTPNCPVGSSIWKLKFDTGAHYGPANTFFPVVELSFLVKEGEHFHVPLLLAPYSFTTYRGS
ncbi:transthyretin-like protein-like protein [Hyaloscypha bicolor E]|uniref:5-hydroxyisourate hydrolase n=1 Tax=Hyaloscypha bicolor E TaxID=1095630 RepID=A0A2J6T358_9HELO|nr:transthyretin-like protein-like protein [Hyaloscypha bicolor E]PMD57446.1 transthyretin-like protein-like protein [Hyaloscypha bicolor E]